MTMMMMHSQEKKVLYLKLRGDRSMHFLVAGFPRSDRLLRYRKRQTVRGSRFIAHCRKMIHGSNPVLLLLLVGVNTVGDDDQGWGCLRWNQINEESLLRKCHCLNCGRCRSCGDLLYCSLSSFSSTTRCCWPHILQERGKMG